MPTFARKTGRDPAPGRRPPARPTGHAAASRRMDRNRGAWHDDAAPVELGPVSWRQFATQLLGTDWAEECHGWFLDRPHQVEIQGDFHPWYGSDEIEVGPNHGWDQVRVQRSYAYITWVPEPWPARGGQVGRGRCQPRCMADPWEGAALWALVRERQAPPPRSACRCELPPEARRCCQQRLRPELWYHTSPAAVGIRPGRPVPRSHLAQALAFQLGTCDFGHVSADEIATMRHLALDWDLNTIDSVYAPALEAPDTWFLAGLLRPFWIRPIADWKPPADRTNAQRSLFEHLLVRYPLPEALAQAIFTRLGETALGPILLVLVGQGVSLAAAGKELGWDLPRRFWGQLAQAPVRPFDSLTELLAYTRVALLGATYEEHREIYHAHGSPLGNHALTPPGFSPVHFGWTGRAAFAFDAQTRRFREPPAPPDLERAWGHAERRAGSKLHLELVDWLRRRRGKIDPRDWPLVKDWLEDLGDWPQLLRMPTFARARREAIAHHQRREAAERTQAQAMVLPTSWASHDLDWSTEDRGMRWQARELTNVEALVAEAQAMRNCVLRIAPECATGERMLVSLTATPLHPAPQPETTTDVERHRRRATIEFDAKNVAVVAAKGRLNNPLDPDTKAVCDAWIEEIRRRRGLLPAQGSEPAGGAKTAA